MKNKLLILIPISLIIATLTVLFVATPNSPKAERYSTSCTTSTGSSDNLVRSLKTSPMAANLVPFRLWYRFYLC